MIFPSEMYHFHISPTVHRFSSISKASIVNSQFYFLGSQTTPLKITDAKTQYIRNDETRRLQSKHHLPPIQLNVLALSDASLANRLPRVYMDEVEEPVKLASFLKLFNTAALCDNLSKFFSIF